jgi:hypothetical protein
MFAHPRCPCTHASIAELERLIARVPRLPDIRVILLKPEDQPEDWAKTDLWRKASSIPGVAVILDIDGIETRRFQAKTSGITLFYDAASRLQFEGGITAARGHEGDNSGRAALENLLQKGASATVNTPVFGCALFETQCHNTNMICKP